MKRKRNIVVPDIMPVGNPTEKTLQRSISKSQGNTVVEYRIHPNKSWTRVYYGMDEVEARRIYKRLGQLKDAVKSGLLKNPTHHYPRTDKGRKGEAKHKRLLEEVFPGMKKGRPRVSALWKADLFSVSGFIDSIIGQGTKQSAMAEAAGFVGGNYNNTVIARVQLSGPYADLDAMEKDITDDEEPVIKHTSIAPKRPRGRPRKIHPIKVIDIDDISSELAIAHAPKRGRGRPRKHPKQGKFRVGQDIIEKQSGKQGHIVSISPHGIITVRFGTITFTMNEDEIQGIRGRPRKS